jgi:hypothetical protein
MGADGAAACGACSKVYDDAGGVEAHLTRQPLCEQLLALRADLKAMPAGETASDPEAAAQALADGGHEAFAAPKYSLCHIIWNVFLMDKEFASAQDLDAIVQENNIRYIIAILPDAQVYADKVGSKMTVAVEHEVMLYDGHDAAVDTVAFDRQCRKIEEHRGRRENVYVFCNNGYQRSIPFLCYYLTAYHPSEAPTVEKAIDLILPQVDRPNYAALRAGYVQSVTLLLSGAGTQASSA